jgi:hypothetical protein
MVSRSVRDTGVASGIEKKRVAIRDGVAEGSGVTVGTFVGVTVAVGTFVGVAVAVGSTVAVAVGADVAVGTFVGVAVAVGSAVAVAVGTGVAEAIAVAVDAGAGLQAMMRAAISDVNPRRLIVNRDSLRSIFLPRLCLTNAAQYRV